MSKGNASTLYWVVITNENDEKIKRMQIRLKQRHRNVLEIFPLCVSRLQTIYPGTYPKNWVQYAAQFCVMTPWNWLNTGKKSNTYDEMVRRLQNWRGIVRRKTCDFALSCLRFMFSHRTALRSLLNWYDKRRIARFHREKYNSTWSVGFLSFQLFEYDRHWKFTTVWHFLFLSLRIHL